jgi:phosphoglucosamine mutase
MQHYFGTDGIRGRAGVLLTPELALRAAFGFARLQGRGGKAYRSRGRPEILLACDSRLSSSMLAAAVGSGLMYGGCDVLELGILPTPAVPLMVKRHRAAGGVMITASHNPIVDNGLKFFGSDGLKLPDRQEHDLEEAIRTNGALTVSDELHFGSSRQVNASLEYLSFLRQAVPKRRNGRKLTLLLDCAHGATCEVAPTAFEQAGFGVLAVNCRFDGTRVNVKCGATDLAGLSRQVRKAGAAMGLAFDGDGDRVLAVDEEGRQVSGDKIVGLFALHLQRYRRQGAVVMTQMTNMGVEDSLRRRGIRMIRTEVGDIQVLAGLRKHRLALGGEQSGHIILRDKLPAGDGILVGLQLAALVCGANAPLSKLAEAFEEYPQQLTNLRVGDRQGWRQDKRFSRKFERIVREFPDVRFYLRPSGTEDVVRVLTEARDVERCRVGNAAVCQAVIEWDSCRK